MNMGLRLIPLVALVFSLNANALLMSEVGDVDTFIASDTLSNSGAATEEAWVESVLGFDVSFIEKDDSGASTWQLISDENDGDGIEDIFAKQIDELTDYFLLKLGNGGTNIESHYLFQNIGKLDWAVVDFSTAGVDLSVKKINIGRVSHDVTLDNTTTYNVPEPSACLLVGLGLIGLVYTRRKKQLT